MAYHTRDLGQTNRPGFVLVQGQASFKTEPDRAFLESLEPQWNRDLAPRKGGLVGRMLHTYYWERVAIEIAVERVIAYPDTAATEDPRVFGRELAPRAAPQKAPRNGTEPRVDAARLAAHVGRLPHTLLGWCGSDDLPEVVPVSNAETTPGGVRITVPTGSVPASGRRAGLTSHAYRERMTAQEQRVYTGWLSSDGAGTVHYAPHTKAGHKLPPGDLAYTLACATLPTRMRAAREAGLAT